VPTTPTCVTFSTGTAITPGMMVSKLPPTEMRGVKGVTIVNPTSSHPGVGADPVGLDEDHLSIAPSRSRSSQVCGALRSLLSEGVLASRPPQPLRAVTSTAAKPSPPEVMVRDEAPREESAVEILLRREQERERLDQKAAWLRSPEGRAAAIREFDAVASGLVARVDAMKGLKGFRHRKVQNITVAESPETGLYVDWKSDDEFGVPLGHLAISHFDGFVDALHSLPPEDVENRGTYLGTWRYTFDRDEAGLTGWRETDSEHRFLTTDELLEGHLKHALKRVRDAG
jgi:hypothetical protein